MKAWQGHIHIHSLEDHIHHRRSWQRHNRSWEEHIHHRRSWQGHIHSWEEHFQHKRSWQGNIHIWEEHIHHRRFWQGHIHIRSWEEHIHHMSSWQGYIHYQEELSQLSQHTHSGQAPHTCTSSLEKQIHPRGTVLAHTTSFVYLIINRMSWQGHIHIRSLEEHIHHRMS